MAKAVYRRPFLYRPRRPWIGTLPAAVTVTVTHTAMIYAYPPARSGPPGCIQK